MKQLKFICSQCKSEYIGKNTKSKFCSAECQHQYYITVVQCDYCGKLFDTYNHNIKTDKKHYCSKECANKGSVTRLTKKCNYCGNEFSVFKSVYDITKYCSRDCYNKNISKKTKLENKICKNCGTSYQTYHHNSVFCSRECSSLYQQKRVICVCEQCGNKYELVKNEYDKKKSLFCSTECRIESKRWSEHDIDIIKKNYGKIKTREIIPLLDKSYNLKQINKKADELGVTKDRRWTDEETKIISYYYSRIPMYELIDKLPNRTIISIIGKARVMNLKSYHYLNNIYTTDEIKYINENYLSMTNDEIGKYLNRSSYGVEQKIRLIGLQRPKKDVTYCYELNRYIRSHISNWKKDVLKFHNYTCEITGERSNIIVHHCRGFNILFQETMEILNLEMKKNIDQYTSDELDSIVQTFLKLQSYYGEYTCVTEKIHKLFHKIYGYGDNTMEQWLEFKIDYINGKYDE